MSDELGKCRGIKEHEKTTVHSHEESAYWTADVTTRTVACQYKWAVFYSVNQYTSHIGIGQGLPWSIDVILLECMR